MIPPRFDWLAPHYAWIERITFGPWLQRTRIALLSELLDARRVLVLGEGDGRFLSAFLHGNRTAEVDVLDASPAMIALARDRVARVPGAAQRVNWFAADARTFTVLPGRFDLIVTNFFLDCFPREELEPLIDRLAAGIAPGGRWLVGDFARPHGTAAGIAAELALALMYLAFAVGTSIPARRLVDPAPRLLDRGLVPERSHSLLRDFLRSTLWRKA